MSDLVVNPEDIFFHDVAHIRTIYMSYLSGSD